jgi:nicotinamidase-related amidase
MGNLFHEGYPGSQVDDRVYPLDRDPVITKRRTSAFAHTELDLVLRANDIQHITLCGVATGAMVAATVYDASDRDYEISVLADACADPDDRVHDLFITTVFPARGVAVLNAREWVDTIHS